MISVVLVEPEGTDNIGSVARAMKNTGLQDLRLVRPPLGWKKKSKKMAVSAEDVLLGAKVYSSLPEAISDRQFVIGMTRRCGPKRGDFLPFDEMPAKIKRYGNTALLFGKESKGLSNEDLKLCDWVTTIPSSPAYPSLNLAQAVMVVAFSLFHTKVKASKIVQRFPPVSKGVVEEVLARFEEALKTLNYEQEGGGVLPRILLVLRRFFSRAGLLDREAQMFKGFSRRIVDKRRQP